MSTNEAVDRAIAIVTSSRQTHVNWAEWRREGHGTDEDHEMVGDLAYHEAAIQDYDHVLALLRTVKRSAPIDALVAYLHPRMCKAVRLDGAASRRLAMAAAASSHGSTHALSPRLW